jgi:DNA-directed RNA polymerase specialized sigma24 family protein
MRDLARFQRMIWLFKPYVEMAKVQIQIEWQICAVGSLCQRDAQRVFRASLPGLCEDAGAGDGEAVLSLVEYDPQVYFTLLQSQLTNEAARLLAQMSRKDRRHVGLDDLADDAAATHLSGIAYEELLDLTSDRGLDEFKSPVHLRHYLLVSVHNDLRGNRKKAKAEKRGGKTEFVYLDASPPGYDGDTMSAHEMYPAKAANTLEILAWDTELQRRLKPGEHAIVYLLVVDPYMTNAQIGTKLGVTEGAVRARRKKISEKLRV